MKKITIILLTVFLVGILSYILFFKVSRSEKNSKRLTIVTTIFPLYDFTRNIVGDSANVLLLLPPGMEPHSFEPKPSDILTIQKADIFIYTHPAMEPWAEDIIKSIDNSQVLIVNAGKKIFLASSEDDHLDPHIWLDPILAEQIVDNITKSIIKKDDFNKDIYLMLSKTYKGNLQYLHNIFKSKLMNCKSRNIIYGGHYAFGYLAKRYGLNYIAAQGFIPDSEPTAHDLINIISFIKNNNVSTIFYEELENPRLAKTLSQETGVKLLRLNAIHTVSKEDLRTGANYVDLMKQNLENLQEGLICNN